MHRTRKISEAGYDSLMSPLSVIYLLLLPLGVLLYYVVPSKARWIVLLLLSLGFYLSWSYIYTGLLVMVALSTYGLALAIEALQKKGKNKGSTAVFVLSLILLIGLLFFFKYIDLLFSGIGGILGLFHISWSYTLLDKIALPVGVSFYLFMAIGYLSDVHAKKYPAERHPGYFALFLSFFPTILAGPIERADHLIPQLKAEHRFSWDKIAEGGRYLLLGYFKKLVVADIIALFVDQTFNNLASASGLAVLLASFFFAYEIYADFSGYSDIAKGSAALFGLDLIENFNQPYLADRSAEFWHRWHISLSTFFRDYVYFPMGGSHCSKFRWAINVLVVFALSGLWHGANWTFLLWGVLFALYQIIGKFTMPLRDKLWLKLKQDPKQGFPHVLRIINTFILVDFAWILFRADSLQDFGEALTAIFTHYGSGYTLLDLQWYFGLIMALGALSTYFIDALKKPGTMPLALHKPKLASGLHFACYLLLGYAAIAAFIYLYAKATPASFVYFNF